MVVHVLARPAAACAVAAAEDFGENILGAGVIAEIGKAGVVGVGRPAALIGEIAVILLAWPLRSRSVDFPAVKARALFRVAQQIIGGRNFLELIFCRLVAGVQIGVQLLRQAAIGLLNVV